MNLIEIKKDIYDVDAWIDEGIGAVGTQQRAKAMEEAWEEYQQNTNAISSELDLSRTWSKSRP